MKTKSLLIGLCLAGATLVLALQQPSDVIIKLTKGERTALAVPDLRGAGEAQRFMDPFNQTLWKDLESSGLFKMVAKSLYPLELPQRPEDFRPPLPAPPARRGAPAQLVRQGPWLADWSGPPVSANYLAFGYTAVQAGQMVLRGWLFNVTQADVANAQVFGRTYLAPLSEEGARKLAHDFATDILKQFGGASLAGTKIYFVSTRTGKGIKEIWSMDPDGSNQKQITLYKSICTTPAVSPDGTKIAFTSYSGGNPAIVIHSLETGRRMRFYGPVSSMVATPEFTPDGQQIVFSYTIGGWPQISIASLD
jgi:TolB protein